MGKGRQILRIEDLREVRAVDGASERWPTSDGHEANRFLAETIIESIDAGVILVDAQQRLTHANAEAKDYLSRDDGVFLSGSFLKAQSPTSHSRLNHALYLATKATPRTMSEFALNRSQDQRPYICKIKPLPNRNKRHTSSDAAAVLVLRDPDERHLPSPNLLVESFTLTGAEADMALAISRGDSVSAYAEANLIKESTARQRLKMVLDKTQTCRQAELVNLVMSLSPL